LLPLVIGFLVALAATALPQPLRPRRWHLRLLVILWMIVSGLGFAGGIAGLL
jgi:hypothetical protein